MRFFIFVTLTVFTYTLSAQEDHFKIEFEAFSPDAAQMIEMLEGNPAEPFEGIATNGTEMSFEKWKGTPMVFWFWDVRDEMSLGQIDGLNLMAQIFGERVHLAGFAYDKKPYVDELLSKRSIDFPILPNSYRLGELHYGSEMGQGRLFLVDRAGIIKKALPREFFVENQNSFNQLRDLIQELVNGEN